jgi:hypothetical protein
LVPRLFGFSRPWDQALRFFAGRAHLSLDANVVLLGAAADDPVESVDPPAKSSRLGPKLLEDFRADDPVDAGEHELALDLGDRSGRYLREAGELKVRVLTAPFSDGIGDSLSCPERLSAQPRRNPPGRYRNYLSDPLGQPNRIPPDVEFGEVVHRSTLLTIAER